MKYKKRCLARRALTTAATLSLCALGVAVPGIAQAADCATLANPVYIAGSSAIKPVLAALAPLLAAATPPITLVYSSQGSCVGVSYMTTTPVGKIDNVTTAAIWVGGAETTCSLDTVTGTTPDIGVSDVYAGTCGATLASNIGDFKGPVQAMAFAVPAASTQTSISAEAAYMVFGFGADTAAHTVAPWSDPNLMFVRNASSGTQSMISAALAQVGTGFTVAKVKGVSNSSSSGVSSGLTGAATAGNQEKAIGMLAMDVIDVNRATIKPLAFKFAGQPCGFTPDSTLTSFDKQNVRDGHYAIWGALHMLTPVDPASMKNAKPSVQAVIDALSGVPSLDVLKVEVSKGVVPDCAMRVSRTSEVGPMASYMPAKSCECAYLAVANGTAPATCTPCTAASATCPACNLGYCEVQ